MLVHKLRLQRGWSQQQLAELSGLSVRTIQRVENGSSASTETLKALAAVFEIDFSTLNSEPDMNTPSPSSPVPSAPSNPPGHASPEERLALKKVRCIKDFYIHLAWYLVVIGGLTVLDLATDPERLWFFWPALGWGLGVLAHAASVFQFFPFFGPEWERRQVEKRLGRPL